MQHGTSKVVSLPISWLRLAETKAGQKITAVQMEVNGVITIQPFFQNEKQRRLGKPRPAKVTADLTPANPPLGGKAID